MPNERSDVSHPLWRKKVDGALFDHRCTVLPIWVRDRLFGVGGRFPNNSRSAEESQASIVIHRGKGRRTTHEAQVTTSPRGGLPVMRLHFGDDVVGWLAEAFPRTHARNELRKSRGVNGRTIERDLPFWEFLDIEWEAAESTFHFRDWYSLGQVAAAAGGDGPPRDNEVPEWFSDAMG